MTASERRAYLFVYGTLKHGCANAWARRLWRDGELVGEATMTGRLYLVGTYPGLKDAPDGIVRGEVALLPDVGALLADLDAYEGDEYRRVLRPATLSNGQVATAWVYMYQPEVTEKQRIESGEFASGQ